MLACHDVDILALHLAQLRHGRTGLGLGGGAAAGLCGAGGAAEVAAVSLQVVGLAGLQGGEVDVVLRHQRGLAVGPAVLDEACDQVDVAPGTGKQDAVVTGNVQTGYAVYRGVGDAVAAVASAGGRCGGRIVDVAPGLKGELVLGGDGAACVVDVLRGGEGHSIPANAATQVVDGVGVDLHHFAAQDGAGVAEGAQETCRCY